jgi:hypothetical protein
MSALLSGMPRAAVAVAAATAAVAQACVQADVCADTAATGAAVVAAADSTSNGSKSSGGVSDNAERSDATASCQHQQSGSTLLSSVYRASSVHESFISPCCHLSAQGAAL